MLGSSFAVTEVATEVDGEKQFRDHSVHATIPLAHEAAKAAGLEGYRILLCTIVEGENGKTEG